MTVAVVLSVADRGLASAVAARALAAGFVCAVGLAADVAVERDVAVAPAPALTVVEHAPAPVVFVADDYPVVASDLALFFFDRVPAAVFALAAFHTDRAFSLPGVLAAHRPPC